MLENLLQTKPINNQDYNDKLIKLHSLLYSKLYLEHIQSTNSKADLEFYIKPKDKYEALHDNFIKYGTKTATNFLIIDIDYINTPIKKYEKEVFYKLGIKPNWITRTTNGYHIGFILEKTVYINDINQKEKLQEVKRNFTATLNGDIAGSHRLIGYWRNPLTHKSIINTELYDLDYLYKKSFTQIQSSISLFDSQEVINQKIENSKKTKEEIIKINIDKVNQEGFIEGNRNNYLFTKTVSLLYQGKITNNQVHEVLTKMNSNQLEEQELNRIEKSILKYEITANTATNTVYKKGDYYQALWDNKIHNYKKKNKIEFSRQKFGQSASVTKKIKNTTIKLVKAYTEIYKNSMEFTNKNISLQSGLTVRTIQIYRNRRKLEDKIKALAFKTFIEDMGKAKTDIGSEKSVKLKFTPLSEELINLINLAISEVQFIYSKTNEVFKFLYKDDSMIFYKDYEEMVA